MSYTKVCFRCMVEQPITEFYVHKEMADGHLNKCKSCTRGDSKKRENFLREADPDWAEREKIRTRERYYRLGYRDKHKPSSTDKKRIMEEYKRKYPEKEKAKNASSRIKAEKGYQKHHWSYREEHWCDILFLNPRDHKKLHRYMEYDAASFMYRRVDTQELLDTKEKHTAFIIEIKDKI